MADAIVFVEGSRTGAAASCTRAALGMSLDVVMLTRQSGANTYSFLKTFPVRYVETDTSSADAVVRACDALGNVVGIGSTSELFLETAAEAAARIGLPGPEPLAVARCRSKAATRSCLEGTGLNPGYAVVSTPDQAVTAAEAFGFPVVVKPSNLTGSLLVRRCDASDQVRAAAEAVLRRSDHTGSPPVVIVEEYLDGEEFCVEVMHGLAVGVTGKRLGGGLAFVETGFEFPAAVPGSVVDAVGAAAEAAVECVGLVWGPAHVELRMTSEGPRILEINARLGGLRVPDLIEVATGVNLAAAYVGALTGRKVDLARTRMAGASIRFVLAPPVPRRLVSMKLDAVRESEGIRDLLVLAEVGRLHGGTGSNWDLLVGALAEGRDGAEARERADAALGKAEFAWGEEG